MLRKDNYSPLVKKQSSHVQRQVPGLFLFIPEMASCLQEAEIGFVHVTHTALLHEGIWHPKLSCLSKPHQPSGDQRSQGWLLLSMYWVSCALTRPRSDRNKAYLIQAWCCKVRACQCTDFDQRKKKRKTRNNSWWFHFVSERCQSLVSLPLHFWAVRVWGSTGEQLNGNALDFLHGP